MKKYISKLVLLSIAVLTFVACDQENERTMYGSNNLAPAYSMGQPVIVTELVPADNGILNVVVARTDSKDAASVQVKLTGAAASLAQFSLASTQIQFAAGQSEANAQVKFTLSNLSVSSKYAFAIELPDSSYMSKGGFIKTSVTANRKLTWQKIGTGTFTSAFFEESWPQDLQQAVESPTLYRLTDCYYTGYHILFEAKSDNSITFSTQQMGYNHASYGMTSIAMPAATSPNQPKKDGNVYRLWCRFVVSAGSFGEFAETFTLN